MEATNAAYIVSSVRTAVGKANRGTLRHYRPEDLGAEAVKGAIGRVDSVAQQPGRNELQMYLTPAAPINEVDHAFVILRRPSDEQVVLEAEAIR